MPPRWGLWISLVLAYYKYKHGAPNGASRPTVDSEGILNSAAVTTADTKANRKQDGPPLPGPLLPRREESENSRHRNREGETPALLSGHPGCCSRYTLPVAGAGYE